MRLAAALLALSLPLAVPAFAADAPADGHLPGAEAPKEAPPAGEINKPAAKAKQVTADDLLARLANAADKDEAEGIERQLQDMWSHSGSPTADLLFQRSEKALEEEDDETANQILVKLTEIAPNFAEGWHLRAAVAARSDHYEEAIAALRQVLALQPKHFGALAELGQILEDFGEKEHALEAYRKAVALDPYIEGIEDRIRELTRDVEGQGI
jgi:tetratricopeptide (TPR) repeat protein